MILVTGASGHLGTWLVRALLEQDHEVICLSRNPPRRSRISGLTWRRDVETLPHDLRQPGIEDLLAPYLSRVEWVFHLAAFIPENTLDNTFQDARTTLDMNVRGTVNLLKALKDARCLKGVTYASSFEVYGMPQSPAIDETHRTQPLSLYGATKLIGEKYLRLFSNETGLPASSLRFPAIYGPGDQIKRAIGNFITSAASGQPIRIQGDGADRRELVYCADAADALIRSMQQRANRLFNVGQGNGYSILEMAEAVQSVSALPVEIVLVERVKERRDYTMSIKRIREDLGWTPATALQDGVKAQLEWVQRQGSTSS